MGTALKRTKVKKISSEWEDGCRCRDSSVFLLLLLLVFGEQVVEAPDRGVGVLADHLDVGIAVAGREQQSL